MIKRNIAKFILASLALGVFSSAANACENVLIAIRHVEDQGNPAYVNTQGKAHAEAYSHLLRANSSKWIGTLLGKDICPINYAVVLNTPNPRKTIEKIMEYMGTENTIRDVKYIDKVHIPELQDGSSTLLVLNRDTMWGDGRNPDGDTLLQNAVWNGDREKIMHGGSPYFNFLYVFKGQNENRTFNSGAVYLQKYRYWGNDSCALRLHKVNVGDVDITSLTKITSPVQSYNGSWVWNAASYPCDTDNGV